MADDLIMPQGRNMTEFVRSNLTGSLIPRIVPTKTVKVFAQELTLDANRELSNGTTSGWTPSGTAPLLITRLSFSTTHTALEPKTPFILADRNGTFDIITLGTVVNGGARSDYHVHGDWERPLYTVQGTLRLYSGGTVAAGTYNYGFEGVQVG